MQQRWNPDFVSTHFSPRNFMLLLIAVLIVSISYSWLTTASPEKVPKPIYTAKNIANGVTSFADLEERFAALAKAEGGVAAFAVLRAAQLPPNTDLHLLGHVVGDVLYEQEGVDGIALCTRDFRNACSHSIVIGTLLEYGDGSLPLIQKACQQAPGGGGAYAMCFHGLGHGVLASQGYNLERTVDFCTRLGTPAYDHIESAQCVGGAIMELMGGGGHDYALWEAARATYLTDDNPVLLCMNEYIPERAKTFCLTYLTPELWEKVGIDLSRPALEQMPDAFVFCDTISHSQQHLRDACYGGFGKEFVPLIASRDIRGVDRMSDVQFKTVYQWCAAAGVADGERACVTDAVGSIFWGGENDPKAAFRFCTLAPTDNLSGTCYTQLARDIGRYVVDGRAPALCAQIPGSYKQACQNTL